MPTSGSFSRAAKPAALMLLAGAAAAVLYAGAGIPKLRSDQLDLVTSVGARSITIEVADTPEKQALGLMFRTSLADHRGMLFPHEAPREVQMWMKNTYIPLDMVFIRADGTVHRIEAKTEPFSERIIASKGDVSAVLELAGGAAERLGLKPGDKVKHPMFGAAGN